MYNNSKNFLLLQMVIRKLIVNHNKWCAFTIRIARCLQFLVFISYIFLHSDKGDDGSE